MTFTNDPITRITPTNIVVSPHGENTAIRIIDTSDIPAFEPVEVIFTPALLLQVIEFLTVERDKGVTWESLTI
jgi:hypothetical protein